MTEQEKQQLSRDVAVKYGIDAFTRIFEVWDYQAEEPLNWLHDDSARCFDLMVSNGFSISQNHNNYPIVYVYKSTHMNCIEYYEKHENEEEATRIAILKALLAKSE